MKMSWFDKKKEEVIESISQLTVDYIDKLSAIWYQTLERKNCEEHLETMVEHANTLYHDIMQETLERRDRFLAGIAERQEEAVDLQRLLKVDLTLSPIKDLPLHTALVKLENGLQDLRRKLKQRKDEIVQLLLEQESLCDQLGEPMRELRDDPLPTEFELQDFRNHLEILRDERIRRKGIVDEMRKEIRAYMKDLEIMLDTSIDAELLTDPHISLTEDMIGRLRRVRDEYRRQVEELRESIEKMKSKLEILWSYLEVSPSIRQKFSKYTEYTQTIHDKFHLELERCEGQKRQNIKKFVDRVRKDIEEWWDKTLKSDKERARFVYFTNECYTEDLLTLHEMELEDLKRFYFSNQKIFELIEQRKTLWDRMCALEAKSSEPGRYNNRGGQLLKEEKERKTIATKLPKIEADLTELVTAYENTNNKTFLVNGQNVLEAMASDWEMKKVEKEKLMSARKNAATHTPSSRNQMRTPLSLKNHSTNKHMPSSSNITTQQQSAMKRKLLHMDSMLPSAKRSLLHELGNPRNATSKTPFKSPLKKTRVIATTIKRKSGRISGNHAKGKRKSDRKTPKKVIPKIKVTCDTESDTMSYDMFEDYIAKDPSCRSSIAVNDSKVLRTSARNKALGSTLYRTSPHQTLRGHRSPINSPIPTSSRLHCKRSIMPFIDRCKRQQSSANKRA